MRPLAARTPTADAPHPFALDPTAVPAQAPAPGADPGSVDPLRPDPIRRAVAERLAIAGRRHTRHRAERSARAGRPGPHAFVFLFREPDPARHDRVKPDRVTVATRMFVDGPDVAELPALLTTLTDRAREYGRDLPDLIAYLADRVEPRGRGSAYLGVAVSSIDTAREGVDPMPWDGLAQLVDGTRMSLHATRPELAPQVVSTHTLAYDAPMWAHHTWVWAATRATAAARTDLGTAQDALTALYQHLRHAEPGWA